MRRFLVGFSFAVVGLLLVSGWFWWQNLRGLKPATGSVPFKIAEKLTEPFTAPASLSPAVNQTDMPLSLPPGFTISLFAQDLQTPRVVVFDQNNVMLVSLTQDKRVVALPDKNGDGEADAIVTVAGGLNLPHGLAFDCADGNCSLLIAETNRVSRFDYDPITYKATFVRQLFSLPGSGNHFTRSLLIAEVDGQKKLLVSVGSSCNVCLEKDERRAAILMSNLDGSDLTVMARGLRNSVFLASNPVTQAVWATDMGRDLIGDDTPPEEVNIIRAGKDYGWPYCYGKNIHDDSFDKARKVNCSGKEPAHLIFQAHSAPLGLAFIPDSWPQEYRDDLLVAYHGSWNRSAPTGYKVARFNLDGDNQESEFISGWLLSSNEAVGRPVGLTFDQQGSLFISDDKAGVIYRVVPSRLL